MPLKVLQDYFKGKKVIIVGNSVEMMDHEYGEFIDSFDSVIRIGRGMDIRGRANVLGTKCDVWSTGEHRAEMYNEKSLQPIMNKLQVVLYNPNRADLSSDNVKYPAYLKFPETLRYPMYHIPELREWNDKHNIWFSWNDLDNEKRTARFSSGIMTIKFMIEKVKTYDEFHMIGFDFFRKTTTRLRGKNQIEHRSWHRPLRMKAWSNERFDWDHDHKTESDYARKWLDEGLITKWHILSDLEWQTIDKPRYNDYMYADYDGEE